MKQKDNAFEKIVESTIKLFEILKSMGVLDHTGAWLQFLHWNQKMDEKQQRARSLIDQIIPLIIEQNEQISSRLIISRIVYDLIAKAIWFPNDYKDFPSAVRTEIKKLIDYKSSRPINIPLVYLKTKSSPANFGVMEICNINDDDIKDEWWKKITGSGGTQESVQAYARVEVNGDHENSLSDGRRIVEDMLIFLRAVSFPVTTKTTHQFGLLNEFPSLLVLPFKIGKPKENYKLEYSVQYSTLLGPGTFPYELERDFLNQLDQKSLEKLNKVIEEDYFNPSTDLKRKFFLGLRWLGEATKPDTTVSRFVKLSFALEALIGGGIENPRGIKKTLATRCATLIAKDAKEKGKIQNAIYQYYKIRSEIVHGDEQGISEDDFSNFGMLVRRTAWSLLEIIERIETIDDLQFELFGPPTKTEKGFLHMSLYDLWRLLKGFFVS